MMKKIIALLLVAVMILALGGCASEGQQLYEKYAPIIDMLEAKDYQGAIRDITAMAIQEQQGNVEKVPVMQVLCDTWTTAYEDAPEELTFSEDGTCVIGGESMTWLAEETGSDSYLRVQVSKDGKICRYVSLDTGNVVPYLHLSYAEERDDGIYSGEGIGTYYNHPMLPVLLRSWRAISEHEQVGEIKDFSINTNDAYIFGDNYVWTILESENQDSLTVHIDGKNDREGTYTVTLTMRGGYPVVSFTDDATGETGLYYNYDYGYDRSWPEYIYAEAMENYNDYLENGSFWCDISELNYSDSNDDAVSYLYNQFVSVGDYADAAQIVENWDSVRYNRAMRLLNYYLNGNGFSIGETYYRPSENALEYIYSQFEEISDYADSAEILGRFTIHYQMLTGKNRCTVDNLNNESNSLISEFEYDATGKMVYGEDDAFEETYGEDYYLYFHYDDAGILKEIQYGNVSAIMIPSYDAEGRMVGISAQYNSYALEHIFTYDEAGRLATAFIDESHDYNDKTYTYTYDDAGRLIQKVRTNGDSYSVWTETTSYTYDENGYLITETQVNEETRLYNGTVAYKYTYTYTYTNDDQGRPLTVDVVTDYSGDSYQSRVITYIYQDLYFFESTGMDVTE